MPEFELLDFDDADEPPTPALTDAEMEPFLLSARERRDYHIQALAGIEPSSWQVLAQQSNWPETLTQQVLVSVPQLPDLSLTDAALLLQSLQPLLPERGEGDLVYHLYHGLAAAHFLKFSQA